MNFSRFLKMNNFSVSIRNAPVSMHMKGQGRCHAHHGIKSGCFFLVVQALSCFYLLFPFYILLFLLSLEKTVKNESNPLSMHAAPEATLRYLDIPEVHDVLERPFQIFNLSLRTYTLIRDSHFIELSLFLYS